MSKELTARHHADRVSSGLFQPYWFFLPAFGLVALVSFIPLGFAILQSVFKSDYLDLGRFVGLGNYYDYALGRNGLKSIWNSVVFVSLTAAVAMPLGFGLAVILNKPMRFRGFIRTILILPWLVSNLIAGLLWAWLLNPKYGVGTYLLGRLGLELPNMITNEYAAMGSVVLAMAWAEYPLVMVFMLGALQTVSPEMIEAAHIDGASAWQRFWHVVFPMVRNTTLVTLILTTLHAFKNVEVILVMTGGGPGAETETMALRVFQEGFQFFRMGVASSGALIVFLMNLMFTLAFVRVLRTEHGA